MPSEDSDQPGHPPSLIRVFPVCMMKAWVLSYRLSTQQRLWSDWVDARLTWVFAGCTLILLILSCHSSIYVLCALNEASYHSANFTCRFITCEQTLPGFSAQLSRRLTRWAYSIPIVRCPHFQTWISLQPFGQSWSNFVCGITRVGKGCIRFWCRLDKNTGFHGNRKPPLTYNGENDVSTFPQLPLSQSFYTCW